MKIRHIVIPVLYSFALSISVKHEIDSMLLDGMKYGGEVVQKAEDSGRRGSTFYLSVDDEDLGKYSISVHPITYNNFSVGDYYQNEINYVPILGLNGAAYRPDVMSFWYSFTAVMCKFLLLLTGFYFAIKWIVKRW